MPPFVIKHKSGGKFVHPLDGDNPNPRNDCELVIYEGFHNNTIFEFDPVEGEWGYIRHISSGKILHPFRGQLNPGNDTHIVLHQDRHAGALFAIDQVNEYIVHKGGKYIHPSGGSPNPGNSTRLVLHGDRHDAMEFVCVSFSDPNKEVMPYGQPKVIGSWKVINAILNPVAEHTQRMEYTVGKSKTESTTSQVEFKWESSASVNVLFMSASASTSLSTMLQKTSSTTWTEETKVSREIKG